MHYDEGTFHNLLEVERARAGRANHPLCLLIATLEPVPGKPVRIPEASASRLLTGMAKTLRETDVVGWYRKDHMAGAVLAARPNHQAGRMTDRVESRVEERLRGCLPRRMAGSLRVRVVTIPTLAVAPHLQTTSGR